MSSVSYQHFTGTAAENYQRDFVPAIAIPVSRELLRVADLQPGERVLDVACGTGLITRLASERVGADCAVMGIDIAPDMIGLAKRVPAPDGAAIQWRVADAAALPIADASVDVVLCQMGLMFMENRAAAIAEMARVLVPSGRVAINTPGRIQPLFATVERSIVDNISPDLGGFVGAVFSMHDPEAVAALLCEGGFREVSASVATATFRLPARRLNSCGSTSTSRRWQHSSNKRPSRPRQPWRSSSSPACSHTWPTARRWFTSRW